MDLIKNIAINALLVCVSILVVLLCLEMVLRVTSFASLLPYRGVPLNYYAESKDAGYDISKNFASSTHRFSDGSYTIWSNELGCFDYPYQNERVYSLLIGDSFTWGFTPFEDKWGTRLESLLGERILKCGVPGYGTKQELQKAREVLAVHPYPSRIILGYFKNDEQDDASFPNSLFYKGEIIKNLSGDSSLTSEDLESRLPYFASLSESYCMWNMPKHPFFQKAKCYMRRHSIVYLLTQEGLKNIIPTGLLKGAGIVNEEPKLVAPEGNNLVEHMQHVLEFVTLARGQGSTLVVVLIPSREDIYTQDTKSPYEAVTQVLRKEGVSLFDPKDDFRKWALATSAPMYWKTDLHLNEKGNHLLGFLVAKYIAHLDGDGAKESGIDTLLVREFGN